MFSKILDYLNNLNVRQVLTLAGVAALLMFIVIYVFLTNFVEKEEAEVKQIIPERPRVTTVIVAKSDISPHTTIVENMVQLKEIPSDTVPNGAITSVSQVVDRPARITILAGDVITRRKLYDDSQQAGFIGSIPPDCRAISINVNNVTGVAGFAKPGDYVDLLLVEGNDGSATTSIILQNVLLLSINKTMNRNDIETEGDEEKARAAIDNPSIATLALRPQEALRLVSSAKLGDIYLMLRPSKPIENYVDASDFTLNSSKKPKEEKPAPAPAPTPAPVEQPKVETPPVEQERKIEIIYGDESTEQPIKNDTDRKPADEKVINQ